MIIFQISVAMFLVMALGFVARRKGYFSAETTRTISLFVVDVAFPSLVFVQFLRTIDGPSLLHQWYLPVLGFVLILLGHVVGVMVAPLFVDRPQRGTFWFLSGMSNWVYLPLPIVEALYGDQGIQAVLLFNVGGQVVLWTVLVGGLKGERPGGESLKNLLLNPGLLATAAGILLALLFPGLGRALDANTVGAATDVLIVKTLLQPLDMVGKVTIPISLIVIGAQLAALATREGGAGGRLFPPDRAVVGATLARLVLAPALFVALMQLVTLTGVAVPGDSLAVCYIIAAMPSAVSCGILVERFGGDVGLAARGVLYSTVVALFSVPAFFALLQLLGMVSVKA